LNGGFSLFEDFFQVVFGTEVPAYQQYTANDRTELNERAKVIAQLLSESPGEFPSESEIAAKQYMLDKQALDDTKPFLNEMYQISDTEWLVSNANIQNTKVMFDFRGPLNFPTAEKWWEFATNQYQPIVSVVKQRSASLMIWSFGGTSLVVEGQSAYIFTAQEMQNQIFLNMIGNNIECFVSASAPINFVGRSELLYRLTRPK